MVHQEIGFWPSCPASSVFAPVFSPLWDLGTRLLHLTVKSVDLGGAGVA